MTPRFKLEGVIWVEISKKNLKYREWSFGKSLPLQVHLGYRSISHATVYGAIFISNWENPMVHDARETDVIAITKSDERRAFVVLAVFLAPIMAGVIVGGYGFMVWMFQLLLGPPTG